MSHSICLSFELLWWHFERKKMAEIGFYSFIIVMSLFMDVNFGANCYHLATKMRLLLLLSFFSRFIKCKIRLSQPLTIDRFQKWMTQFGCCCSVKFGAFSKRRFSHTCGASCKINNKQMRNWQNNLLAASTPHRIYSTHNTHAPFWNFRIVTIAARNRGKFVDCNNEISR